MIGPVFQREAATSPRRSRLYVNRTIYVTAMLVLMCTAWLVLAGTQLIQNVGDMARFGSILFQILAPLQLSLFTFLSALLAASAVSQEKDRRTLILLLMTRMSNRELVLGKLAASLLNVLVMLTAGLPVLLSITLFGGVSLRQVWQVFAVTALTAIVAGSLGSTLAFWREKTFQTLAMTALGLLMYLGLCEIVYSGLLGGELLGVRSETLATALSPVRAIFAAARPSLSNQGGWFNRDVSLFLLCSGGAAVLLNSIAIALVRHWNPSREVRPGQETDGPDNTSIWGVEHDLTASGERAESRRSGHVDARVRTASTKSREVWDNPILWREVCTWAYGRKVLIVRLAYVLLFAMTVSALYALTQESGAGGLGQVVPAAAQPLAPFFLVSLVVVNALAVTSVTNERDGQALDLLLVTDLSPREFVVGKMLGVFWVAKEMVLLPMVLAVGIWWQGLIHLENLLFLLGGLLVMDVFAAMLGIHCGMAYANSRTAIGTSLGTVFFLFLGVVTCLVMMISFSGSFQTQLTPFLAFILGGSVGLYVALGWRNPSQAIFWATLLLPIATFYSITSFLLDHMLAVFLVTAGTYGFTIAAMLLPAIGEFDIAMGRTKTAGED